MNGIVLLDRRFIVWTDKDSGDPDGMSYWLASREALTWTDLLAKHRVVVLAEAGSGKSSELSEQARLNAAAGRYTFSTTVQNVGRYGLADALGGATSRLQEWRKSDQPAWFFFDSVDEAKASDIRLEDALRAIAVGIEGSESRAHIVLSGRHTDWEFRRDLERVQSLLGMPPPDLAAPPVDPNELIVSVIRRDKGPEQSVETEAPLVVVMAALDRMQGETFARTKGVANVDAFFRALDKSNLITFARRPLDLDWLIAFWRRHGKFGPLAKMLELSLGERLQEPDLQRARKDPIDVDRAMLALERIGAALVLNGLTDIAVPDSSLELGQRRLALDLGEILPDWSGEHRVRLISRAVFDPASAGFARLHNDNQGAVRSFLAARWLKRLMDADCPKDVITDLLFATTYGISLVIPSMRQTAAWLSLWRLEIAREVIERDPLLLMDAGDPASLPLEVREQALKAIVAQVVKDDEFGIPDRDSLRRFALPDMVQQVRGLWATHGGSPAVRELLLLMIGLGELASCADLAVSASFGAHTDRYTQVFSGRALLAVGSDSQKQSYVEYIKDHAGSIPSILIWDAVDAFFPRLISVEGLLQILKSVDLTNRSSSSFDYLGPNWADRIATATQAERLTTGLLDMLKAPLKPMDEPDPPFDEPLLSTIEAVGRRLLELCPPTKAPASAINAALRLGDTRNFRQLRFSKDKKNDLLSLLRTTPERRRETLWKSAERLTGAKLLDGKPITNIWQIEFLGVSPGLTSEDFTWLLQDAEHRQSPNERQLATDAALALWRQGGKPADRFAEIQKVGRIHAEVAAVIDGQTRPRPPSEQERAHERAMHEFKRRGAVESATRDQSWRDFADRLRADPNQLRAIEPPTAKGVDARLFHLWQLLNNVGGNQSRYAIHDLSPLEPMLGHEVVSALRDAFVTYWRQWSPKLRGERPEEARNTISALDCIGIVGVTLEAAQSQSWAVNLTYDDAVRAAIYATLELNGFPPWFHGLAQNQPDAVCDVLTRAIASELELSQGDNQRKALDDISRTNGVISSVIANQLFEYLRQNKFLSPAVLTPILRILRAGYREQDTFTSLLFERFASASSVEQESIYFASLFELDSAQATVALDAKLSVLPPGKQTLLVQTILPMLVGGPWGNDHLKLSNVPFQTIERLLLIAFGTVRPDDDNDHSDGKVYTPNNRDDAESARGALFKTLIDTPGAATFDAIRRFETNTEFPIPRQRLVKIARDRAGSDSEHQPWSSADVYAFESDFLTVPRNPLDLQRLVLRKLSNLQYDLLNSDFAQGKTVARLQKEADVQNWIAEKLRESQGRSYSVEREPHVVEEKEPDIRFRAKASDASVPVEIKVSESWSLEELENALKVQLIGRYLRDRHSRHGVLLLVHQRPRVRGWQTRKGEMLTFVQVVNHLRDFAHSIAAENPNSPQAEIAVIDVSSAIAPVNKPRKNSRPNAKARRKRMQSGTLKARRAKSGRSSRSRKHR